MKRTLKAPRSGIKVTAKGRTPTLPKKRPRYEESSYSESDDRDHDDYSSDDQSDSEYKVGESQEEEVKGRGYQGRGMADSSSGEEEEESLSAADAIIVSDNEGNVETRKVVQRMPKESP
jgi:hypothetical protein